MIKNSLGHGKMNMAVTTASIDGLPSGFYIIASVFESSSNARYFRAVGKGMSSNDNIASSKAEVE